MGHGQQRIGRNGSAGRPPAPGGEWTRPRKARASHNGKRLTPLVERLVEERREVLQLLAALRSALPAPDDIDGFVGELDRLDEYDRVLTLAISDAHSGLDLAVPEVRAVYDGLLMIGRRLREDLQTMVPWRLRPDLQAALATITVRDEDLWRDVDAASMRQANGSAGTLLPPPLRGVTLPGVDRLEVWLFDQPRPLLQVIAGEHEVDPEGHPMDLAQRISTRLSDVAYLSGVLAKRLSSKERGVLARYVAAGVTQFALMKTAWREDMAPAWAGTGPVPSEAGARLRALGLVFLGRIEHDVEAVAMPQTLQHRLGRILVADHPEAMARICHEHRVYLRMMADSPEA